MQKLSLKELRKFVETSNLSFIRFTDATNEVITPWNIKKFDTVATANNFIEKVTASIYPDGTYYLHIKDTLNGKQKTVPIQKGNDTGEENSSPKPSTVEFEKLTTMAEKTDSVSYKEYMELKIQVIQLQQENERLQEIIDEYEEEEDLLGDAAQSSEVSNLIKDVGLPLFDKYLELEEKKLQLLGAQRPVSRPVKQQQHIPHNLVQMVRGNTMQPARPSQSQTQQPLPNNRDYGNSQNVVNNDTEPSQQTEQTGLTPEQYVEVLSQLTEDELIDFYNQMYLNGQGNEAYEVIEQYRPEMLYIFNMQS